MLQFDAKFKNFQAQFQQYQQILAKLLDFKTIWEQPINFSNIFQKEKKIIYFIIINYKKILMGNGQCCIGYQRNPYRLKDYPAKITQNILSSRGYKFQEWIFLYNQIMDQQSFKQILRQNHIDKYPNHLAVIGMRVLNILDFRCFEEKNICDDKYGVIVYLEQPILTLEDKISTISEIEIVRMLNCICQAQIVLKKKKYLHLQNILLCQGYIWKINELLPSVPIIKLFKKNCIFAESIYYPAPEEFDICTEEEKSSIFSLGMCILHSITKTNLSDVYQSCKFNQQLLKVHLDNISTKFPLIGPMLQKLLQINPEIRPNYYDVLQQLQAQGTQLTYYLNIVYSQIPWFEIQKSQQSSELFLSGIYDTFYFNSDDMMQNQQLNLLFFELDNNFIYQGGYQDGQKDGYGRIIEKKSNHILYEGQFKSDKYDGYGVINNLQMKEQPNYDYSDFSKLGFFWQSYFGDFKDGKKNGMGQLKLNNFESFIGQFRNDLVHGYGIFIKENGEMIKGRWVWGIIDYILILIQLRDQQLFKYIDFLNDYSYNPDYKNYILLYK
ncbi:hypothetical protein pb186bvf_011644 [Paramecium bursaria]